MDITEHAVLITKGIIYVSNLGQKWSFGEIYLLALILIRVLRPKHLHISVTREKSKLHQVDLFINPF